MKKTFSGFIALTGRPNVGKSTLINALVGEKLAITSRKPQTTRHRLLGIQSTDTHQWIFVDLPGIHSEQPHAFNRYLNKTAQHSVWDADVVLWLLEAGQFTADDAMVYEIAKRSEKPMVAAINKIDALSDKKLLLPYLQKLQVYDAVREWIPISAKQGDGVTQLQKTLAAYLPEAPFWYPEDTHNPQSQNFQISEMIREALLHQLGQEVPHQMSVVVDKIEDGESICTIHATLHVAKKSHKPMVIGAQGQKLKAIGTMARLSIEILLQKKVMLKLWVRVNEHWVDHETAIQKLGYGHGD